MNGTLSPKLPDGLKNYAVFNAANVRIVKIESIEVELKRKGDRKKYVLVENSKQIIKAL